MMEDLRLAVILQLSDLMKGTEAYKYYSIYKRLETIGYHEIEAYRNYKLKSLISHAVQKVPYYKDVFKELKIKAEDIRTFEDLKIIPVLTREIIQEQGERLYSIDHKSQKTFRGSSSGSTGTPIKYLHDKAAESASLAALYREMELCGWKFSDHGIHVWGNNDSIRQWNKLSSKIKSRLFSRMNVASPLIDLVEGLPGLLKKISNFHPVYADGYPNSLVTLAKYCQQHQISLPIERIFTTAENYSENQRQLLENVFKAKVFDFYGCGEINSIAAQKDDTRKYFIYSPRVHVDVLEGAGEWKELVITDLDNKVMPFLRYLPGDLVDGLFNSTEGNDHQVYFNQLIGRVSDVITLKDGRQIHPVHVFGGTAFRRFPQISKHKVTWDQQTLKFYFEVNEPIDQDALNSLILSLLADVNLEYEIILTSKLKPGPNGKFKYFEIVR